MRVRLLVLFRFAMVQVFRNAHRIRVGYRSVNGISEVCHTSSLCWWGETLSSLADGDTLTAAAAIYSNHKRRRRVKAAHASYVGEDLCSSTPPRPKCSGNDFTIKDA